MSSPPRGLLLLSMGGPRRPDEVLPYLEGLFGDPRVIDLPLPAFLRRPLTRLMARRRAPKARRRYERIGGGSPLPASVETLVPAVETALRDGGEEWTVAAAFRYLSPTVAKGLETLRARGCREIVLCPLHPHRCRPTTGSLLHEALQAPSKDLRLLRARPFGDDPRTLDMVETALRPLVTTDPDVPILFVAHSVPERLVAAGDPYVDELRRSFAELARRCAPVDCRLFWQGRVGPLRWVGPALDEAWPLLAAEGITAVKLAPLSFFFDHVETLVELDLEAAEEARAHGIAIAGRMPLFGPTPALVSLVATAAREARHELEENLL